MSPEVCQRIFEPFFTTKVDGGTGLGLATVFVVVEGMGGTIDVESTEGVGTAIVMSFPAAPVSAEIDAAAPAATLQRVEDGTHQLRILAVDDEPGITRSVQRLLRGTGHTVAVSISGEDALDHLAGNRFDVVLSDLGMGAGMNGWELATAVRLQWPETRFVLATGWGAAIDPTESKAKGVETVLAKPYRPDQLFSALGLAPRM